MPKYAVEIDATDYRTVTLVVNAPDAKTAEHVARQVYAEQDIEWDEEGTLEVSFVATPITEN